jgi:hypothetical protein
MGLIYPKLGIFLGIRVLQFLNGLVIYSHIGIGVSNEQRYFHQVKFEVRNTP